MSRRRSIILSFINCCMNERTTGVRRFIQRTDTLTQRFHLPLHMCSFFVRALANKEQTYERRRCRRNISRNWQLLGHLVFLQRKSNLTKMQNFGQVGFSLRRDRVSGKLSVPRNFSCETTSTAVRNCREGSTFSDEFPRHFACLNEVSIYCTVIIENNGKCPVEVGWFHCSPGFVLAFKALSVGKIFCWFSGGLEKT